MHFKKYTECAIDARPCYQPCRHRKCHDRAICPHAERRYVVIDDPDSPIPAALRKAHPLFR